MNAKYNIRIAGMSAVVPKEIIDNEQTAINNSYLQKVIKMTGVRRRHKIPLQNSMLMDYAVRAAEIAINKAQVDKNRIKFLVYLTQTPDYEGPSTALPIQKQLGISTDCMAFDVNLGCTGFVAGIQIVSSMLYTCFEEDAVGLVIIADRLALEPRENQNDAVLFGDAATATILCKDNKNEINIRYSSDGNRYHYICKKKGDEKSFMDGDAVFQFSISEVPDYISQFMKDNNIEQDNIDYFIAHQAQDFIIKHIAKKINITKNKLLFSLNEYGNTSGSSIPMTLCANKETLKEKSKILGAGFGVGLAWGIIFFEIENDVITEVYEM